MKKNSHSYNLIKYLLDYNSITSFEAFTKLYNARLSATVYILRKKYGLDIDSEPIHIKNIYGNKTCFHKFTIKEKEKYKIKSILANITN